VINTFALGSIVMDELLVQVLLILGAGAAVSLGRWGWRFFIIGASRKVEATLRQKLYDKWTVLGQRYFQSHKTGDLMALATNDLQAIRMATGFFYGRYCGWELHGHFYPHYYIHFLPLHRPMDHYPLTDYFHLYFDSRGLGR
jgi:ABC-type multidrug transport system fused ATPase/permease subunit